MSTKLKLPSVIVAIALLGVVAFQEAYAAPNLAAQGLRAVACCARNCRQARCACGAADCCHVAQAANNSAIAAKGRFAPWLALVGAVPFEGLSSSAAPTSCVRAVREIFARPVPIFLLDRSLRL